MNEVIEKLFRMRRPQRIYKNYIFGLLAGGEKRTWNEMSHFLLSTDFCSSANFHFKESIVHDCFSHKHVLLRANVLRWGVVY